MTRSSGRLASCSKDDARSRLTRAQGFMLVAEMVVGEEMGSETQDDIPLSGVAAALAVLSGIAAADAACCHSLGTRSRGQDHAQALELVKQVTPEGDSLAKDLRRLLDLKDNAHYGILNVSEGEARKAVEWCRRMVSNAEAVLKK